MSPRAIATAVGALVVVVAGTFAAITLANGVVRVLAERVWP